MRGLTMRWLAYWIVERQVTLPETLVLAMTFTHTNTKGLVKNRTVCIGTGFPQFPRTLVRMRYSEGRKTSVDAILEGVYAPNYLCVENNGIIYIDVYTLLNIYTFIVNIWITV